MCSKIIAIANQKGGTGKTATAAALWSGLALEGYKVLGVDLDGQCNFTFTAGAERGKGSALGLIAGESAAETVIQKTAEGDIIPGAKGLHAADMLMTETGKEYRLREALESVADDYDYIILDTPPHFGVVTVNAITAAHRVIIPIQADIFSLQGLHELGESIEPVKKYCNPSLEIDGVLFTRHNPRTVLAREIKELAAQLAANIGTKIYNTTIREAVAVREAAIKRQSLFKYAPYSAVTADYKNFIAEFLKGATV